MGVAPERVVAGAQGVIAREQRVDLGQTQRACVAVSGEPALDALAVLRDLAHSSLRPYAPSRR